MICDICKRPIPEPEHAWIQVIGYVRPNGKDAMLGRKDTGAFCCVDCVIRMRHGVAIEQEALV